MSTPEVPGPDEHAPEHAPEGSEEGSEAGSEAGSLESFQEHPGKHPSEEHTGEDWYAREHVRYPIGSKEDEEQSHLNRIGPKSERRCLPWRQDDNQEGLMHSAARFHNNAIAMALITIAMNDTDSISRACPPRWAYPNWQGDLYGAMTNTYWDDARDPLGTHYGLSFREAGALVALLDSITGGKPGQTYMDHYLAYPEATADDPGNKMAEYIRKLGFRSNVDADTRRVKRCSDSAPPAFCLLPFVLQEAITLYTQGTEGYAALLMRLAPPKLWRPPSPGPFKSEEHEAYNKMVKRDREGPAWEPAAAPKRARPASAMA
jgi:hypothetical protein